MFKPLNGRVLVKPDEVKDQTEFGLLLVTEQDKPVTGVVATSGTLVKEGDRVLFSKYAFDEVTIEKQLYYVIYETNVLGIF